MIVVSVYSLVFLVLTMGARYLSRPFVVRLRSPQVDSFMRCIFGTAILGMIGALTVLSGLQYSVWAYGEETKFLLAPYHSHWYFLNYVWWRLWAPYAIALLLGAVIGLLAYWYNKRHGGDLFYDDEPYFIALAIFLVGQPGWIIYFLMVILVGLAIMIIRALFGQFTKFSLYDLWLPIAAFVILIMQWLAKFDWFLILKP